MLVSGCWPVENEFILILSSIEYPVSSICSLNIAGKKIIKIFYLVLGCLV